MWPLRRVISCGAPLLLLLAGDAWAGFVDIHANLSGVWYASSAWGDYDNDGDLDILLTGNTGSGRIARVYRNMERVSSPSPI